MSRVKRGVQKRKRRKKLIKQAKGFRWSRKNKYRLAKDALKHAWVYAYRDRKKKKQSFRQLWQIKIGAASRANGINYSKLLNSLRKNNVVIDRKILADLAEFHPDIFKRIIDELSVKSGKN